MRYLTVAETAERLGVRRETVYAYVSRGLLTSVRGEARRRGSRFAQDEVERLAARGREARAPSGAVERIRTSITLVSDDGPFYRGVPVPELARDATPEGVAALLWGTADEPRFVPDRAQLAVAGAAVGALPPASRLTDRFRVAVAAAAAAGLRPDAGELVFAVARTVGWVAHALEEYREPGLRFRPSGVYVGARPG